MTKTNEKRRFTVIIPTENRAKYLYHTLRTCSNQDYENLEIIVSDDGSFDNTREIVEEAAKKDSRIKYITPGLGVGMLDNFEFALNQVKPGFVMALGGDDGLMPNSISRMNDILNETGKELLTWPTPAFFYPNTKIEQGQIIIHIKKTWPTSGIRIIESNAYLKRQAKELFYVADIEAPMFYVKGVVSTDLVEKVRKRSQDNRFYSCSTPDGYSGIVLAGEVETYAFSGVPLSIHGVSPSSHGLSYLSGKESAKRQSDEFFKKVAHKPMHKELATQPYSPLITLMTADFLLTASDLPGWGGKFPPINFKDLLSKSLSELEDGLFSEDRISRELDILHKIAEQNDLTVFFNKKLATARRNSREALEGNAISPRMLYFDAKQCGISNVFDASYFAYYFHQIGPQLSFSMLWNMWKNSVNYKILSYKKKKKLMELISQNFTSKNSNLDS